MMMKLITKRELAAIIREIGRRRKVLAKERDTLRQLRDDVVDVLEPTERAIIALDEAIGALSEYE